MRRSTRKPDVRELLRIKMETPEIGTGSRMGRINDYLDRSIEEIEAVIDTLPPDKSRSWAELDQLFLSMLANSHRKSRARGFPNQFSNHSPQ